jgi:glycerophosphoryl diester phosphodiesterase
VSAKDPFALDGPVEIIAHRGFSEVAPENTLAALESAIAAGADAVEFDVHTAADGTPVLMHDGTLERTTNGTGSVAARSPEELANLDAGAWFGATFSGEPVPTLRRAMLTLKGRMNRVYVEIKGMRHADDVALILAVVRDVGMLERTVFISMDWEALARIRGLDRNALLGYIVESKERSTEALQRASGDACALVDFDARILLAKPELARQARVAGVPLATWTVDAPKDAALLVESGVPRITTNRVTTLTRWRDGLWPPTRG